MENSCRKKAVDYFAIGLCNRAMGECGMDSKRNSELKQIIKKDEVEKSGGGSKMKIKTRLMIIMGSCYKSPITNG